MNGALGANMKAACQALRLQEPRRIGVAVAVRKTCNEFRADVDEMVCAFTPAPFLAVAAWYQDLSQTTDEEVQRLLEQAERGAMAQNSPR